MTYCVILNICSKYVVEKNLKKNFCLTVAQGLYFDSTSLVDNDTWTMAKDWQNEVLHRVTICFQAIQLTLKHRRVCLLHIDKGRSF